MEAASQPPQPVAAALLPPAPRRVSAESFLQGTTIAWAYLQPADRKAIRTCCRAGRLQHDRMLAKLQVALVHEDGDRSDDEASNRAPPPPSQMRTSLQRMVGRGARPQSLSMYFADGRNDQREAYLLAALGACSPCPLSRLELRAAVPLSGAVAEAVEACCPQLDCLTLDAKYGRHMQEALRGEEASEYHLGCVQLLTLCGPRLQRLSLLLQKFHHWQPLSYMALRRCTALVSLELEAGRMYDAGFDGERGGHRGGSVDAHLFGVVSHLRTLRRLHLVNDWYLANCTPNAVRPHATCVARLSALTGLKHLGLVLSDCYEHDGHSYYKQRQDDEQHGAWVEVREAHRTSLLSALRCMPQLLQLYCPTLWLRPSEAAPLAALTSIILGGLLPPPAGAGPGGLAGGGGSPARLAAGVPLPPQLQELSLKVGASPRALAQLQPPPSLVHLDVGLLRFGVSDVDEDRLRPEAVAAVGPAVRTLVACRHPTHGPSHIRIRADAGAGQLLPREGSPNGHMEWVQQLRGLEAFRNLTLTDVRLRPADLCCLGQALPDLQGLVLHDCHVPVAALPGLRPHMTSLTSLDVDLGCHDSIDPDVLISIALLLARPHPGAAQLQHLKLGGCPGDVDIGLCEQSIKQQLEDDFGVTGVEVELMHEYW